MPEHGRDYPDKANHPSRQVHRGAFYEGMPSEEGKYYTEAEAEEDRQNDWDAQQMAEHAEFAQRSPYQRMTSAR